MRPLKRIKKLYGFQFASQLARVHGKFTETDFIYALYFNSLLILIVIYYYCIGNVCHKIVIYILNKLFIRQKSRSN